MNTKKKAVAITYNAKEIELELKKYYRHLYHNAKVRIIGLNENSFLRVKFGKKEVIISNNAIAEAFGGIGGHFNKEGNYVEARVDWVLNGSDVIGVRIWKDILTWDEFNAVMREHNIGFADKGNPDVWKGVVVYSPSASGWKRYLWDCDFEDRAYSCHSNGEIFLEEDPSSGLCRHPHCIMTSLRGDRAHGGETLLRPEYNWVVDYCYIEEC